MGKLQTSAPGFHASEPAYLDGIGDYFSFMLFNGHTVAAYGNETAGVVYDLQEKAGAYPGVEAIGVYRKSVFPGWGNKDDDVPVYGGDLPLHAELYWNEVEETWPPELDRGWVYVEMPNEVDKNESEWLGQLQYYLGLEAIRRGYNYVGMGWASGEPEADHWPYYEDYLRLCEKYPDRLGISLHEYTYDVNKALVDTIPYNLGRVGALNDFCLSAGITPPMVVVTECGWCYDAAPDRENAVGQIKEQMLWDLEHAPNVRARFYWTLAKNEKWGSELPRTINSYMEPLKMMVNMTDWPDPAVLVPEEELDKTKRVVFDLPESSEISYDDYMEICGIARREYGRSVVTSFEDGGDIVRSKGADPVTSYVDVWEPDKPSQARAIAYYKENGIVYYTRMLDGGPGIKLINRPVKSTYVTQPFGANPDYYSQYGLPGHEGVDLVCPMGDFVHAVADGRVVWASNLNQSGRESAYGWHVVIDHGGYYATYAHLAPALPMIEQTVTAGALIGYSGNSGNSTGPHLHFGISVKEDTGNGYPMWRWGQFIDPAPFLAGLPAPPARDVSIDMYHYFYPVGGSHSDIYILKNNWGAGDERSQLIASNGASYISKGGSFEKRMIDSNAVWFLLDTSMGGGRYYTVESSDGWMPRFWKPGDLHSRQEVVKIFSLNDCAYTGESSKWLTTLRFDKLHLEWVSDFGIELKNVIQCSWLVDNTTQEQYYYAPGLGLVGWADAAGRASSVSETIPLGTQENNVIQYPACMDRS